MTENRWGDTAPEFTGAAPGYDKTTARPTRRIALHKGEMFLGHVWTDDHSAAGWLPAEPTETNAQALARARAYVWRVHALAYERGEPASAVLESRFYEPMFSVDRAG